MYIVKLYACTIYIADLLNCMIYVHELKIKQLRSKFESCPVSGAPNDNFGENICSEDDLISRFFGTFAVKFLACLPLLGF